MKTESAEDLETNLVGVVIVVLAIEFLGQVFSGHEVDLLQYGAGIALPIAALALFLGVRLGMHARHRDRRTTGARGFGDFSAPPATGSPEPHDGGAPTSE
jgi:uncharacterized membrane protein YqhA